MNRQAADKPRILVSTYSFFPFEDANTNVIMPLIDTVQENFSIDILTCNKINADGLSTEYCGLKIYRYPYETGLRAILSYWHHTAISKSIGWMAVCKCKFKQLIASILVYIFPGKEEKMIKELIQQNSYDAIISVTSPITTQWPLLQLSKKGFLKRKGIKWIPLFQDPYSFYLGFIEISDSLLKFEKQLYMHADGVFVTPELLKSYETNALSVYRSKMCSLNLANMQQPDQLISKARLAQENRIHCVYIGSFQDIKVRDPEYIFKVARETPEDIFFHFIVSTWDKSCSELRSRHLEGVKNVKFYDPVSLNEAKNIINEADILINVGNNASNQIPSKVIDYICTGKPIVNFFNISDDTSKRLLDRYPLALNLWRGTDSAKQAAVKISNFCKAYLNKRLDYQFICSLYPEYCIDHITAKFTQDICSILENN